MKSVKFSCIWTDEEKYVFSVPLRENTDQENLKNGQFLRSDSGRSSRAREDIISLSTNVQSTCSILTFSKYSICT